MTDNTDVETALDALSEKYSVSRTAIDHLYSAVIAGHGSQAQFSHPQLGGMGQWSLGGMIMIGDMFNHGLKAKVDGLCTELSTIARDHPALYEVPPQSQRQSQGGATDQFRSMSQWWPAGLGTPSSTGAQNEMRYAFFPSTRRLVLSVEGQTTLYDTADHQISGFSQQQGGRQDITFSSQHGQIDLADLKRMDLSHEARGDHAKPAPERSTPGPMTLPTSGVDQHDVLNKIERLGALHARGILSDDEFQSKKTELLSRI